MREFASTEKKLTAGGPPAAEYRALVERVALSLTFQKSNRLRELLLFLCERAVSDPDVVLHEQDVGMEVFGRSAGYDTTQDTLVRVQVSQLRKKLQQYFDTMGSEEPVIIEIPKGGYTPIFRVKEAETPIDFPSLIAEPSVRPKSDRLALLLAVLAGAGIATALWLVVAGARDRSRMPDRPTVELLWRQMFANNKPLCLVPSDASLVIFQDRIGQIITLKEYKNKDFPRLAKEGIPEPVQQGQTLELMSRFFTHVADAHLAGEFAVLAAAMQVPTEVIFARDFGPSYLQSQNAILLGSRRSNPWVELFEGQLNFRTVIQADPAVAYFQNRAPRPGESPTYSVDWGKRGFCRVAFLPNLTRTGSVLLISGTDMNSTEAGGQFISSERWVRTLRERLGLAPPAPFPYFEVLLKVDVLVPGTPKFDIVTERLPKL